MKITRTASGKKTIKMSKSEWERIGKKAGWMKTAFGWGLSREDDMLRRLRNRLREIGFEKEADILFLNKDKEGMLSKLYENGIVRCPECYGDGMVRVRVDKDDMDWDTCNYCSDGFMTKQEADKIR